MKRAFLIGLGLWVIGTLAIRFSGHGLLAPGRTLQTGVLYLTGFALMALLIPRIPAALRLEKDAQFAALTLLILPTLVLDALACWFFPAVYPNLAPAAAGLFGGWMLVCCAGAVVGAWLRR
jgi:hypothetical protein